MTVDSNMIKDRNVLIADESKVLTNGEAYGKIIIFGKNDKIENWWEIDESNIPEENEV